MIIMTVWDITRIITSPFFRPLQPSLRAARPRCVGTCHLAKKLSRDSDGVGAIHCFFVARISKWLV